MEKLKQLREHPRIKQLADVRNIGLYIFGLVVLSVSWSGMRVIQTNYGLQQQIATLEQEAAIAELENSNLALRNTYFESDQFLELAARRQFGLAAPGEKMIIVPKNVALAHTVDLPAKAAPKRSIADDDTGKPEYQQNLEAWLDLFLHRQAAASEAAQQD